MAQEHCAECGASVDADEIVYNDFAGVDVCPDCDDALNAQEAYEVSHGMNQPPRDREAD